MTDIGLAWVAPAPQTNPDDVINFARSCEAMGAHSMWTIDRIAYDNLDALTLLSVAAGATRSIRLGTSVLLGNTRHATHLAKTVATLDFLSGGRVTLGLGFGSRESDYRAVDVPFEHRGTRAVEQVELMKRLWTEDAVSHHGRFYHVEGLSIGPRPIQTPHPPIWVGGSSPAALSRAGTWADGYIGSSSGINDFDRVWGIITDHATEAGRDPATINKATLAFMVIDDDQAAALGTLEDYMARYYGAVKPGLEQTGIIGSPAACVDKIGQFVSKGLDTLIIAVVDPDPRQIDRFGQDVLPQITGRTDAV